MKYSKMKFTKNWIKYTFKQDDVKTSALYNRAGEFTLSFTLRA